MKDNIFCIRPSDVRWRLLEAARDQISVAETLDSLIAIIRATARAVCCADGVTFVMRDGDKCHYVEEDAISPLWKGQRFPMETCISGWAMLNSKTAVLKDIYADDRIPHNAYRKTFVKSLVMVPVRTEVPVAAIGAYWREQQNFKVQDVATIEALADAVGEAMSRAVAA